KLQERNGEALPATIVRREIDHHLMPLLIHEPQRVHPLVRRILRKPRIRRPPQRPHPRLVEHQRRLRRPRTVLHRHLRPPPPPAPRKHPPPPRLPRPPPDTPPRRIVPPARRQELRQVEPIIRPHRQVPRPAVRQLLEVHVAKVADLPD